MIEHAFHDAMEKGGVAGAEVLRALLERSVSGWMAIVMA